MEIQFATSAQNGIADLMWKAKDMDEVNELIRVFGTDGHIVYNMILAHTFDEIMDVDLAEKVIQKVK